MFIKCYVDEQYQVLIIDGTPSEEELLGAWEMVQSNYAELSKSLAPITQTAILFMEINSLELRYISIVKACEFLKMDYDADLVAMLLSEGYALAFNVDDRPQYFKDIEKVERRSKSMLVQIKHKTSELEKLMDQEGPIKRMSREDFFKDIASLSKFVGYRIDIEAVTLAEYVANRWLFYEHLKQMQQAHGRLNH